MTKTFLPVASVLLALAACGDSGDPPPGVDASGAPRVAATVRYSGSAQGTLILAAFPSMPPMGPPAGVAQRATPSFPAAVAIEDLPEGTAYVLAMLDVAPASPQSPGPEDLTAWSSAMTLAAGQTATVELTLTDP
jgi:hypothetical protein